MEQKFKYLITYFDPSNGRFYAEVKNFSDDELKAYIEMRDYCSEIKVTFICAVN